MAYEGNNQAALRSIANRNLTRSMQTLLGICTGIAADGHINDTEIHFLKTWLLDNESLTNTPPGSEIAQSVSKILQDGMVSEAERNHLLQALKRITGNYFTETGCAKAEIIGIPFDTPAIIFNQTIFCFTGQFDCGLSRSDCERVTEQMGAITAKTVSKKVNYLVIGAIGSPDWVHESFGQKIADALRLKEKNHPIFIISEKHWNDSIPNHFQHRTT